MKLIHLFYFTTLVLVWSCSEAPITHTEEYEAYLSATKTSQYTIQDDISFWSDRLTRMPNDEASKIKLAGLHAANFRKTGNVEMLEYSDSLYHHLLATTTSSKAGLYLGLAQNSITQHQFKRAQGYAEQALVEGGREAASLLVITDVAIELNNIQEAKKTLERFTNKNSFAHLIRQSKIQDHEGSLESAINTIENGFNRIKGNKDLYCWTLSNLGDMYGHAGRIEEAYRAYLSVLQKDPEYDYALKGIAWIALSHDKNYQEAKRIISVLASRSRMPEAHLMLAEIAEMQQDEQEKIKQLNAFVALTDITGYKIMYAKYLAELYAEDLNQPEKSLAIAEEEIANRPTPQSFDLKAWALFQLGRKQEALVIAQKYVEGRTFEPDAAYHLGIIYQANGFEEESEKYLEEALQSSFELGPVITNDIKKTFELL